MVSYWIGVASKDHVENGLKEGICQLCHGKSSPLRRMKKGDWIIYYSSKEKFGENKLCQKFTAIGEIADDIVYQYEIFKGFTPYRRKVNFISTHDVPIMPLIEHLDFIKDKRKWGAPFRFGFLNISEPDFKVIHKAMCNPCQ